ncbi:PAS domain S-box protein [Deefgea piscis]|uniref:Sensory/regulatory protein RpfC n=1 Tax=Deefgea piscis TaxID=2739061 RepID=A0A6M8SNB3_9NEIS|nr:ATP-binding protein [Deefgea piscis]QKJ66732.1 PAS domain S-box protein [Deefgea piscis]
MNRMLARQLKRHLAWADEAMSEAQLCAIEEYIAAHPEFPCLGLGANFRRLLTVIDEAYQQSERDLALSSRSLQISSDELTRSNDTLRLESETRQRAIDALWQTACQLQMSLGLPVVNNATADLEQLSILMGQLVDARQQAELALQAQAAQFQTLVNNIPGVVFRREIAKPWGMQYIDKEIEVLSGYTPNLFLTSSPQLSYHTLIMVDDMVLLDRAIATAVAGGERYSVEYRIHDAQGVLHWVYERGQVLRDTQGQVQYLDGILFDITEQKQAAQQVRQLSAAIEASPNPVLITNLQGLIEYANPKFEQTFGFTSAEMLGRSPVDVLGGGVPNPVAHNKILQQVLQGQEWHKDLRNICKDGSLIWMSVSISPIREQSGEITHFVAVYDNIELRKAVETELINAKEAADQANRLKSDFLANMSHEIRTPMNAIIGMTHLTLQTELNNKQRDYLSKISLAAESLLHILNDILDFSKIEADRLGMETIPFRFDQVLNQVRSLHEIKAEEKKLELEIILAQDCPSTLLGDPLRIGQILNNLVSNAIKFTKEGKIKVSVEVVAQLENKVRLHIAVQDSGIGLTPIQMSSLFKPFSQADSSTTRKFGGTGLGLSICKSLVEMMEGELWVESQVNLGSTFHFTAWLACASVDIEVDNPTQNRKNLNGVRILLVEDNPLNQQVAQELLTGAGASVLLAQHGGEALGWLSIDPLPCDFIFMDLQMPVLDGHQTTQLIRSDPRFVDLPIIAMTAHAMSDERQRCLENGMNDYITKPIRPDVLFATVIKWAATQNIILDDIEVIQQHFNEDHLIQFPGINTQELLQRFMGDKKLYTQLFKQFLHEYKNGSETLTHLLKKDLRGATLFVHSMKGVAGTLGMHSLLEATIALENNLKQDPKATTKNATAFCLELDRMIEMVSTAYSESAVSNLAVVSNSAEAELLIEQLFELLDACDGESVEIYYKLRDDLEHVVDVSLLDRLGCAIANDFDFSAATRWLKEIQLARGLS